MRPLRPEFDSAIIGTAMVWTSAGRRQQFVYSGDKMAKIAAKRDGMSIDDAADCIDSGEGAYIEGGQPIIVWKEPDIRDVLLESRQQIASPL